MQRRALVALVLLGCKPPSVGEAARPSEPGVPGLPVMVVEREAEAPPCELVAWERRELEVETHADWLDLWNDRGLSDGTASPPANSTEARAALCARTREASEGAIDCTEAGRQVLVIPVDAMLSMLVVEPSAAGLRSIELSRWPQICRCSCGSALTLIEREPLRVVVAEYESVATEVHFDGLEGGEIVEGCDEGDECQTACMGDVYGSQRLLVFDDSLGVRDGFVDDRVDEAGGFELRFALERGRVVALGECTQILAE